MVSQYWTGLKSEEYRCYALIWWKCSDFALGVTVVIMPKCIIKARDMVQALVNIGVLCCLSTASTNFLSERLLSKMFQRIHREATLTYIYGKSASTMEASLLCFALPQLRFPVYSVSKHCRTIDETSSSNLRCSWHEPMDPSIMHVPPLSFSPSLRLVKYNAHSYRLLIEKYKVRVFSGYLPNF